MAKNNPTSIPGFATKAEIQAMLDTQTAKLTKIILPTPISPFDQHLLDVILGRVKRMTRKLEKLDKQTPPA